MSPRSRYELEVLEQLRAVRGEYLRLHGEGPIISLNEQLRSEIEAAKRTAALWRVSDLYEPPAAETTAALPARDGRPDWETLG